MSEKFTKTSEEIGIALNGEGNLEPCLIHGYIENSDDFFGSGASETKYAIYSINPITSGIITEEMVPAELVQHVKKLHSNFTKIKFGKTHYATDEFANTHFWYVMDSDLNSIINIDGIKNKLAEISDMFKKQMMAARRTALLGLEDFASRYMFKKHVLVKGEKGTKQYYGSIAA